MDRRSEKAKKHQEKRDAKKAKKVPANEAGGDSEISDLESDDDKGVDVKTQLAKIARGIDEDDDAEQQAADDPMTSSKTHKKEYARFCRQCANPKKMPHELAGHFKTDRADLFQMWMNNSHNLAKCVSLVQRKTEKLNKGSKDIEWMTRAQLEKILQQDKVTALIAKRTEKKETKVERNSAQRGDEHKG